MTTPATERKMPAPLMNPEAQPWFDAAAQGKLIYRHCTACNLAHHYPRNICPHCFSPSTEWKESAGKGEIYSYSVLRRGTPVPYCIAYIALDEGVTIMSNIVDCDFDAVRIGMRVKLQFTPADGGAPMPVFSPDGQGAA